MGKQPYNKYSDLPSPHKDNERTLHGTLKLTTASLVLHRRDSTFLHPIDLLWDLCHSSMDKLPTRHPQQVGNAGIAVPQPVLLELLMRQVGVLVQPELVGLVLLVVLVDVQE